MLSCAKFQFIKKILYTSLLAFTALLGLVWLAPLPFTACSTESLWCASAFFFTSSGGAIGFFIMLIVTSVCYALSADGLMEKTKVFFKSIFALCAVFGILAYANEHLTKPLLKAQRPSHVYMLTQTGLIQAIDSLYTLDKSSRQAYFSELLKTYPDQFKEIDADIQEHWIEEAGFSFPSGHTFNAFLYAVILAYPLLYNRSFPWARNLYFLPFIWAVMVGISRVSMGAHTPFDVTAGAAFGILIGYLFLYSDRTRHWLTRKP